MPCVGETYAIGLKDGFLALGVLSIQSTSQYRVSNKCPLSYHNKRASKQDFLNQSWLISITLVFVA